MGFSKDGLQMAKKHFIEGYFPVRDTERLHTCGNRHTVTLISKESQVCRTLLLGHSAITLCESAKNRGFFLHFDSLWRTEVFSVLRLQVCMVPCSVVVKSAQASSLSSFFPFYLPSLLFFYLFLYIFIELCNPDWLAWILLYKPCLPWTAFIVLRFHLCSTTTHDRKFKIFCV